MVHTLPDPQQAESHKCGEESNKYVNACEDFIEIIIVIDSLIVTAALATFQLKSANDTPAESFLPKNIWTPSDSERRECLILKAVYKGLRQVHAFQLQHECESVNR